MVKEQKYLKLLRNERGKSSKFFYEDNMEVKQVHFISLFYYLDIFRYKIHTFLIFIICNKCYYINHKLNKKDINGTNGDSKL